MVTKPKLVKRNFLLIKNKIGEMGGGGVGFPGAFLTHQGLALPS